MNETPAFDYDQLTLDAWLKGWEIFSPDWGVLSEFPTLPITGLCALSVGLHQYFAAPRWVNEVAIPYFGNQDARLRPPELVRAAAPILFHDESHPPPIADGERGRRIAALEEYLRRVAIAAENLQPKGELPICKGEEANGLLTVVKVPEFIAWAEKKGWSLPDELFAMCTESSDADIGHRAETTYLNIIGGLLGLLLGKTPSGRDNSVFKNQAAVIEALLGHYPGKPGVSKRTLEDRFAKGKESLERN